MKPMIMSFALLLLFSSCDVQRAMDRNRQAIEHSTCAIEKNVDALEKVTTKLEQMHNE